MSDLVERLKSAAEICETEGFPPETKACHEAAARITELEAEVKRLRESRRETYDAGFNDGLTGVYSATTTDPVMASFHEPRRDFQMENVTITNTSTGFRIDPLKAAFYEPHRGNGAVPYAPTEEV